MIDARETGQLIKKRIMDSGITVERFADRLNINKCSFSRWFNGENLPSLEVICMIAYGLECSIDELIVYDSDVKSTRNTFEDIRQKKRLAEKKNRIINNFMNQIAEIDKEIENAENLIRKGQYE